MSAEATIFLHGKRNARKLYRRRRRALDRSLVKGICVSHTGALLVFSPSKPSGKCVRGQNGLYDYSLASGALRQLGKARQRGAPVSNKSSAGVSCALLCAAHALWHDLLASAGSFEGSDADNGSLRHHIGSESKHAPCHSKTEGQATRTSMVLALGYNWIQNLPESTQHTRSMGFGHASREAPGHSARHQRDQVGAAYAATSFRGCGYVLLEGHDLQVS